jgi:hypothetical protein
VPESVFRSGTHFLEPQSAALQTLDVGHDAMLRTKQLRTREEESAAAGAEVRRSGINLAAEVSLSVTLNCKG